MEIRHVLRPHVIVISVSALVGLAVIGSVVAVSHFLFPLYYSNEQVQAADEATQRELDRLRAARTDAGEQQLRELMGRHLAWDETGDSATSTVQEPTPADAERGAYTLRGDSVIPPAPAIRHVTFLFISPTFPAPGLAVTELVTREFGLQGLTALTVSPKVLARDAVADWYRKTLVSSSFESVVDETRADETELLFRKVDTSGLREIQVIVHPLVNSGLTGVFARWSWDEDWRSTQIFPDNGKKEWWTDRIIAGWLRAYVESQPR